MRLITPQAQDREIGYELAHERLIPALMQQAGKELSAADKANQLLDRRVNEWLGNQRQARYWFGPLELWRIERQLPYLVWGPKRRQKEQLLRLSRRRIYGIAAAAALVICMATGLSGWLLYTPAGQMRQVRTQLWNHIARTNSTFKAAHGALAYAKHSEWATAQTILRQHVARQDKSVLWFIQEATRFLPEGQELLALSQHLMPLAENIKSDQYKSSALRAMAAAYVELKDPARAQTLLAKALTAAEALESDWSKSSALGAIAAASVELKDPARAQTLLAKALTAAEALKSDGQKASRVSSIIEAIATVPDPALRQELFAKALKIAQDAEASVPMVEIATLYAQQQQWVKALAALKGSRESEKIVGLTRIFTAEAESKDFRLIEGAIVLPTG